MKLNLTRKEWDTVIKALSNVRYTEEDYEKDIDDTFAGQSEGLAEKLDIEYCKNYTIKPYR